MKSKQIINEIDRFTDSRLYEYALMIDGAWGCGKTYFVEKELMPHLQEKGFKVIYVSLYGQNSANDIAHTLLNDLIRKKVLKPSQLEKGGAALRRIEVLLGAFIKFGVSHSGQEDDIYQNIINLVGDFEDYVIIFDDLERCGCAINEAFGFVNSLVEHTEASVILVANECEIGHWQLEKNPELQMLVAANKSIEISRPETVEDQIKREVSIKAKPTDKLTIEELEHRRRAVFSSNEQYRRVKEKVVGKTIRYEAELPTIFLNLIGSVKNEVLKKCLISEVDTLVEFAEKDEHPNIRTFQFFLERIQTIFEIIDNQYKVLHSTIVQYCYRSSIALLSGKKTPIWKEEIGAQSYGDYWDTLTGYKFVDDYLTSNTIDGDHVRLVLANFEKEVLAEGELDDDPLQKLNNWYMSEDDELVEDLIRINEKLENNEYSVLVFPHILELVVILKSKGVFDQQCDSVILSMKESARKMENVEWVDFSSKNVFFEGKEKDLYKEYRGELEKIIEERTAESKTKQMQQLLNREDWAAQIEKNSREIGKTESHSFLHWIDYEIIIERIRKCNNLELNSLRSSFNYLYGNLSCFSENRKEDKGVLVKLYNEIDAMNDEINGQVKRTLLGYLKGDLERYIERM